MQHVDAVRRFNRFYTRRIGVLREGLLGSSCTLTEARLIYELAQVPHSTATVLGRELSLDLGYLSRLLQSLKRRGTPEDIANLVVFLASDAASFITGQTIVIDGGWGMH